MFTRRRRKAEADDVVFVKGAIGRFAKRLRAEKGKDVWLVGGGELFGAFLDAGAVDEFVLHVIPTFIGEGIPLLSPRRRDVRLRLRSSRTFKDGVVRLHYAVARGR